MINIFKKIKEKNKCMKGWDISPENCNPYRDLNGLSWIEKYIIWGEKLIGTFNNGLDIAKLRICELLNISGENIQIKAQR